MSIEYVCLPKRYAKFRIILPFWTFTANWLSLKFQWDFRRLDPPTNQLTPNQLPPTKSLRSLQNCVRFRCFLSLKAPQCIFTKNPSSLQHGYPKNMIGFWMCFFSRSLWLIVSASTLIHGPPYKLLLFNGANHHCTSVESKASEKANTDSKTSSQNNEKERLNKKIAQQKNNPTYNVFEKNDYLYTFQMFFLGYKS